MKKYSIIFLALLGALTFSCDVESTDDVSQITVYPELTINGDALVYSEVGQPFNDPGANASVGGSAIEYSTSGDLDTTTPGFYTITYAAANSDGFEATASRTVIIYENDGSVAGVYDGIRISRGFGGPILISSRGDGDFNISDLMGGYYEFGVGYGNAYAFPAIISVDVAGGTVTSAAGGAGGFGPCSLTNGVVSSDGKEMTWTATLTDYAFGFDVKMTKVTP
ncbi:DUF5011 domain-containing protein [Aestuariibaculum sp. YM273]|uniref:immunoglobulin-like domain-containing protein n=1 Tax=Aestuariibaculum sp. YM273 TaxID=3070659 RepID=UPI0027DCC1F5|nr:immunoglobulin-like domain-containing protein [Aestuariibaculum sp. YM273]WMI66096.1 DUF5011 domain-containing protein [Aestuariibaculum sp. YM273]